MAKKKTKKAKTAKRPAAKKSGGKKAASKKKPVKRAAKGASRKSASATLRSMQGDWAWHELMTPDPNGAKSFYTKLFGWSTSEMDMGDRTYTLFHHNGQPHGGMMGMSGPEWQGVPPHWMIYVSVNDVDATAARAVELGARMCVPPTDIPVGRFAVMTDPHGATISIYKSSQM